MSPNRSVSEAATIGSGAYADDGAGGSAEKSGNGGGGGHTMPGTGLKEAGATGASIPL
jgi:hypothetical protein